ncbi:MAG: hypothetical protein JNK56_23105, partial [Myxococcales bacterium]|nr:hypothetical protein [Myxococcales bacterium]
MRSPSIGPPGRAGWVVSLALVSLPARALAAPGVDEAAAPVDGGEAPAVEATPPAEVDAPPPA